MVLHIGETQRRAFKPRHRPQRRQIGLEHEVAVARLPAGQGEARDRGHLHIDREQVVAGLGSVRGNLIDKGLGIETLTLQATLHIGHRQHHGIDLALGD